MQTTKDDPRRCLQCGTMGKRPYRTRRLSELGLKLKYACPNCKATWEVYLVRIGTAKNPFDENFVKKNLHCVNL